MHISNFIEDEEQDLAHRKMDLTNLLLQPSDKEKRPCRGCHVPCPCKASKTCCCACSSECTLAPRFLSSDPEHYPIEKRIVPLVYAMNLLRLLKTCWSCEGHLSGEGRLHKLPQIWFYSDAVVYPQLIAEVLHEQKFRNCLSHRWSVSLCIQDYVEAATTFVIKPDFYPGEIPDLDNLQEDVKKLATVLVTQVRQKAREYIRKLNIWI